MHEMRAGSSGSGVRRGGGVGSASGGGARSKTPPRVFAAAGSPPTKKGQHAVDDARQHGGSGSEEQSGVPQTYYVEPAKKRRSPNHVETDDELWDDDERWGVTEVPDPSVEALSSARTWCDAAFEQDRYLAPFRASFENRLEQYAALKARIVATDKSLATFARYYRAYGVHRVSDGVMYREWAPNATRACLVGDFNEWKTWEYICEKDEFGCFFLHIADDHGKCRIPHNTRVKVCFELPDGQLIFRIPAWINRAVKEADKPEYNGVFWNPPKEEQFSKRHPPLPPPKDLRIYEAHVGIAGSEPRVHTYKEFTQNVLPRIHRLGFNAVQLMAIMEHAYYASFGYHVTNFFAASSRYGTPEDLKELVYEAHKLGIVVLLDIVHSHASKNIVDGINMFDGTDHHFFHGGARGCHELWDSRLFNYGNWETLRFLLSNLAYWIDVFDIDGFRFDGITSMLYTHHGMSTTFGAYEDYFGQATDTESLVYLMLANDLVHLIKPTAITIAEDVSGFPTLGLPIRQGGIGFDYRLAMAIPDKWIEILKTQKDEEWNLGNIVHTLLNRRFREKVVAYAESHDQALVGDKTIAFWLMDKDMYDFMSVLSPPNMNIDRGIALHKMIRGITYGLGGEAYLTFMGNEFGHPEWLDFPRLGNNESYHYARRQYDLADDELLKYKYLQAFEAAMHHLEEKSKWLCAEHNYVSRKHEDDKTVVFERGDLVFCFNFHPVQSHANYQIGVRKPGSYVVVLNSDSEKYGGCNRIAADMELPASASPFDERPASLKVYLPTRTMLVLMLQSDRDACGVSIDK